MRVDFNDDRLFEIGRPVILSLDAKRSDSTIEDFRRQHGRHVAKLESLESISDAEAWVGAQISIRKSELPEPEDGEYFSFDLEGCTVYAGGEPVGTVTRVSDYGSTALLEVDRNGKEVLIPFAKAFLQKVDTTGKRIEVELPDGLLEVNE